MSRTCALGGRQGARPASVQADGYGCTEIPHLARMNVRISRFSGMSMCFVILIVRDVSTVLSELCWR